MRSKLKHKRIAAECGYWSAARYLKRRGYGLEDALWLLLGKLVARDDIFAHKKVYSWRVMVYSYSHQHGDSKP